jgi:hypothetical protein
MNYEGFMELEAIAEEDILSLNKFIVVDVKARTCAGRLCLKGEEIC